MRSGLLKHRILVEQKTVTVDTSGDRTEAWATFLDCYAEI
jgi:head-tail adaptor